MAIFGKTKKKAKTLISTTTARVCAIIVKSTLYLRGFAPFLTSGLTTRLYKDKGLK